MDVWLGGLILATHDAEKQRTQTTGLSRSTLFWLEVQHYITALWGGKKSPKGDAGQATGFA